MKLACIAPQTYQTFMCADMLSPFESSGWDCDKHKKLLSCFACLVWSNHANCVDGFCIHGEGQTTTFHLLQHFKTRNVILLFKIYYILDIWPKEVTKKYKIKSFALLFAFQNCKILDTYLRKCQRKDM